MINREDNIFYNVIRNETSLTEVFCNFMKYKQFREIFLKLVAEKNESFKELKSHIKFDNFSTEKVLDDKQGRADLVLEINEDTYIFELKIEMYTRLTENQPVNYLNYLEKQNPTDFSKRLFFILPKGYMHLSDIGTGWNKKDSKYFTDSSIMKNNIVYWEDILNEIRKNELDKLNPFIDEFCKILDYRWFKYEKITFTKQEIELIFLHTKNKGYKMLEERSMPTAIIKLYKIVDDIFNKIDSKNIQSSDYYGYIVNNKTYNIPTEFVIFFGIDFGIWEKTGSPIIIQVESSDEIKNSVNNQKIRNLLPIEEFKEYKNEDDEIESFYYIFTQEKFESNDENIIATMQGKIMEVVNKFNQSN